MKFKILGILNFYYNLGILDVIDCLNVIIFVAGILDITRRESLMMRNAATNRH